MYVSSVSTIDKLVLEELPYHLLLFSDTLPAPWLKFCYSKVYLFLHFSFVHFPMCISILCSKDPYSKRPNSLSAFIESNSNKVPTVDLQWMTLTDLAKVHMSQN